MTRRIRLVAAAAVFATLGGHAGAADAVLEAIASRFDAGRVEAGTQVRHTYELRNIGTKPLQILAKPECGCTTTDYDREIPAGGTGKITAVLDTTHMRGRVEKIVNVRTNDPDQRVLTLTIIADSQPALVVEPSERPTLRGPSRMLAPAVLTVHAPDGAAFRITGVEDDAMLRATVVPLDPAVAGNHRRYQVTLTPAAGLAVGSHTPKAVLLTSLAAAPRFDLAPTIVVIGPLVAVPAQLRVGPAHGPVAVRITASDGAPFQVLRAEPSDRDFSAEAVAVAGEPAWNVTVRYTGKPERRGPLNAVLTITTDAPAQPIVVVRLAGKL